jgi:hypothetical protein
VSEEIINLGGGSVVSDDSVTIVVDVQDEVLALLKERIRGGDLRDMEAMNLTMTAKPMRPISPLKVDNDGEQDRERRREMQGRTLVRTSLTISFKDGERWRR